MINEYGSDTESSTQLAKAPTRKSNERVNGSTLGIVFIIHI